MDLAQNNVPELQNQLSELSKTFTKFDKDTGKFQIMPEARRQLKEVADALGIDRAEFEKMAIESAKIEKKMSEIDFSGLQFKATDEQKSMLANLSEFNKDKGNYTVKFTTQEGEVVERALNQLTENELKSLEAQQNLNDPQKELVQIAKEQLGAANTLVAQDAALTSLISTQYAISKEGNEFLKNSANVQGEILKSGFETFSLTTQTGKDNSQKLVGDIQGSINKGISGDATAIADLVANFVTGLSSLTPIIEDAKRIALENPGKVLITEGIKATGLLEESLKKYGLSVDGIKESATKIAVYGGALVDWFTGEDTKRKEIKELNESNVKIPEITPSKSSPPPPTPTPLPKGDETSQVKEIKHTIELTVKADVNNTEVATAVTKAFSNDDTLRELRTAIAKVASDYGLTVA
jgi:hypothetical protein